MSESGRVKRVQRPLRLDVSIDRRLVRYAERTRRSINAAANHLLDDALARAEAEGLGHVSGTSTT